MSGFLKLGVTPGDLNGIGPELILKTFLDARMLDNITPVIYGNPKIFSFYKKQFAINEFNFNTCKTAAQALEGKINVVACWEQEVKVEPGIMNETGAKYAFQAFESAVADLQAGEIQVLVTGPVNKQTVSATGVPFKGHTEYLAEKFSIKNYLMVLASGNLRVGVVTGHIPLREVAKEVTTERIVSKAKILHQSLVKDFGLNRPNIAILGLNPHSGDNGLIGKEEQEVIEPAIKLLKEEKLNVFGPFSPDGFFGSSAFTKFDGILAMYHDQGLVPFKTLAFETGVNYTAGLPVIRTSPDHGPAFDIAGKNIASESSFREAVYLAEDIFRRSELFKSYSANPLPVNTAKHSRDF